MSWRVFLKVLILIIKDFINFKYLLIMIIAAIILGLVIIGLIILINHLSSFSNGEINVGIFLGIWLLICVVIEIGLIIDITQKPRPKAMDVYQGKTTLEYTIKDGEVIDSVVVFKENNYGND